MGTTAIFVIAVLIFLGIAVTYSILRARQFNKDGKVAEGTVIELRVIPRRRSPGYKVTCEYQADGGEEIASDRVTGDLYGQLQIGSKVSLLYLPYSPKDIQIQSVLGQPGTNPPEHA